MVAMIILFGALLALMVVLGVLAERRQHSPFVELGAQELQEYTRAPESDAAMLYRLTRERPAKVTDGELAGVFQAV